MLIPSKQDKIKTVITSLSRGMNANSQLYDALYKNKDKSIKRDEC